MKNAFIVLLLLTAISCKNENKEPSTNEQVVEAKVVARDQVNILNWEEVWTEGEGSVDGFKSFGKETESKRIFGINAHDLESVIWECVPDSTTMRDGGFETSRIPIDNSYAYRYSAWIKKTGGQVGKIYHAVGDVEETTGESVRNGFFFRGGINPQALEEWYLLVGYIYPYNYQDDIEADVISGIYDIAGIKVAEGSDYRWKTNARSVSFRTLLNNCKGNLNERLYIWNPQLFKIDQTEPTLESYFDF